MIGDYDIRPFATMQEFHDCVDLQEETWGRGFTERVAPVILKVSQILGGVAAGAYDAQERLVGFVFGMTGLRDGEIVHWSDMLAVRPEARDAGLGYRLKAYQREDVMARGVEKMFWTFDPLQSRNAHLNLNKLGVVVREYVEDMYGDTDSPLHRGIGTDRLVALWLLGSERVRGRLAEAEPHSAETGSFELGDEAAAVRGTVGEPPAALAITVGTSGALPRPSVPDLSLVTDAVGIMIPSDIGSIMDDDLPLAVEWRHSTRAAFRHYLSSGYEVTGFQRAAELSSYTLTRIPDVDA